VTQSPEFHPSKPKPGLLGTLELPKSPESPELCLKGHMVLDSLICTKKERCHAGNLE
jgi:hypothetical protein